MPKINRFISKKKLLKNINLGDHFLFKEKHSNFNNKNFLLLKPGPILDGAALRQFTKYNTFLEGHSFF
jgi:hypothetical protein